ncbi:MAG TPA: TolC family protein [Gracilimonas sp.]|uniref:TolC family protein n=1 Tax=Gracilimonas sp. TaxID=1974203 RepID=UPI002DA005A2|nr:TolC family protein [Gracilimonas sp.]
MNKSLLSFLAIIAFALISFQLQAQDSRTLNLEESIEIAKQNSPLARAANFSLVSAKWRYKSFRADLLPSLTLSGDAPNYNKSIFSNVQDDGTVTFSSRTQSEASVDLTIEQSIMPTGGNLSLSSGITRLGIFESENTYLWQSTPLVASYRQPIFQFNSLKWRSKIEPLRYQIAQKQFVEDMENLAFNTTQSFFDFLLAKINVEVAEFNVTVNDSIYNISQGRYHVGSIAENDLLQSELALRNAETSLTTASLNFQRAEENFKALLGIPDQVEIEVVVPEEAPALNIDVDKALELARENNSTSLEFELSEIQANQSYAQARKEAGFSATLQASFGLNQTSEELAELYNDPQNRQFFTLGFEIPIFNWGKNTAEIQSARNQQASTANTIAYQKLQFALNVRSTVREFSQLQSQVDLAQISDEIAERRYDVAKNRYLIGKIDITNLFIAQNEKDSARRSYIQALRNYWTGYYNLRRLTLYDFERDAPIVVDTEL